MRDTVADHNGVAGMTATHSDDLLVVDSHTSYNNWRGIRGAEGTAQCVRPVDMNFVDYAGGQKFLYMHRATFRRHTAVGNLSAGLWFDFDNRDIVVEDSNLCDNLTWGVFFEASPGPLAVTGSRLTGNEIGAHFANSENGTLTGNTIAENCYAEIFAGGQNQRWVNYREGGGRYLSSQNWTIRGNTIATDGDARRAIGTRLKDDGGWQTFVSSLDADHNTYSYTSWPTAWQVAGWQWVDLSGWRAATGRPQLHHQEAPPPS